MQIFFTSGIGPDILMNVLEDCIVFLIWQPKVSSIFILSKNKDLQSGALLKMPASLSPSMEEFGGDIQK